MRWNKTSSFRPELEGENCASCLFVYHRLRQNGFKQVILWPAAVEILPAMCVPCPMLSVSDVSGLPWKVVSMPWRRNNNNRPMLLIICAFCSHIWYVNSPLEETSKGTCSTQYSERGEWWNVNISAKHSEKISKKQRDKHACQTVKRWPVNPTIKCCSWGLSRNLREVVHWSEVNGQASCISKIVPRNLNSTFLVLCHNWSAIAKGREVDLFKNQTHWFNASLKKVTTRHNSSAQKKNNQSRWTEYLISFPFLFFYTVLARTNKRKCSSIRKRVPFSLKLKAFCMSEAPSQPGPYSAINSCIGSIHIQQARASKNVRIWSQPGIVLILGKKQATFFEANVLIPIPRSYPRARKVCRSLLCTYEEQTGCTLHCADQARRIASETTS